MHVFRMYFDFQSLDFPISMSSPKRCLTSSKESRRRPPRSCHLRLYNSASRMSSA